MTSPRSLRPAPGAEPGPATASSCGSATTSRRRWPTGSASPSASPTTPTCRAAPSSTGRGMELVITLGTGVGCAVFFDGMLLPHMELSHGRFGEGLSIEVACGDNERHKVGKEKWRERVLDALDTFEAMVLPDHIFIGGGNAKRLDPDKLGPNRSIVPNMSGLLGGIALWERQPDAAPLGDVPVHRRHLILRCAATAAPAGCAPCPTPDQSHRHHRHPRVGRAGRAPRGRGRDLHLRELFDGDSGARRGAHRDRRRPRPRLLQAPHHPRHAAAADRARARGAGLPERIEAMFAGAHINTSEDRAVLHTALRAAARRDAGRRRPGRRRRRARGARPDGRVHRRRPLRRVDRAHRRADPRRRQHRHRRLRPRAR